MEPPWISPVDGISSKWVSNHPIRVILKGPSFKGWKWMRARQCAALLSYKWDPASPNHPKHCPMLWGLYINEMKLEVLISLGCWYTAFFFFYTGEFNTCTLNSHTPFLKKKNPLPIPCQLSYKLRTHCMTLFPREIFSWWVQQLFHEKKLKKKKKRELVGPTYEIHHKDSQLQSRFNGPKTVLKANKRKGKCLQEQGNGRTCGLDSSSSWKLGLYRCRPHKGTAYPENLGRRWWCCLMKVTASISGGILRPNAPSVHKNSRYPPPYFDSWG